jgi:mRNA-degrading endonuclease toxin of MazEF toxin-antitoxin module
MENNFSTFAKTLKLQILQNMPTNQTQKPNFIKNFLDWFALKPQLDQKIERIQFSERDVWMTHLGTNIGFEIDGKKAQLLRPCIVYKKLSHQTALVIPLTHTVKNGNWYSPSNVKNEAGSYCLHQIKMIDVKRFKYRIERISEKDFAKLIIDFNEFISQKNYPPE